MTRLRWKAYHGSYCSTRDDSDPTMKFDWTKAPPKGSSVVVRIRRANVETPRQSHSIFLAFFSSSFSSFRSVVTAFSNNSGLSTCL